MKHVWSLFLIAVIESSGQQPPSQKPSSAVIATGALRGGMTSPVPLALGPAHGARTVAYHPRDLVTLSVKVRYTTTIVLPEGEDIIEVTCGDKEFWIVNAHGPLAYVKPAKAGSETNLNLLTASGQLYAFVLTEVSDRKGEEPDLAVYVEPDDPARFTPWHQPLKYVPAQQVEDFRAQVAIAKEETRRATEAARSQLEEGLTTFRRTYPLALKFPYWFKADRAPFFVRAMFHDDHVTYIQAQARELPALYELKDDAPNLVQFEVHEGTYVIPKVLDAGYLAIGKQRLLFARLEAR
jgi:type IV secretory pathway VirB9-like protein